jgi:hypothetical protein
MARIGQSGSATRFVIIGTLMAILLIGGVFLVRQQTIQSTPTVSVQGPTNEPAVVQQKSEPEKEQKEEAAVQDNTMNLSATGKAVELPKTGSTETLGAAILLATLSYVATSYVRSRRPGLLL